MRFYSPLRYPGGKGRLLPLVVDLIKHNNLKEAIYIEPYAGGAGLALGLLLEEHVWNVAINDLDRGIYAFWHTVLNHAEWLCKKIENIELSIEEWTTQRNIYNNRKAEDLRKVGLAALYLNRTNRSGILGGGIIGGYKQKGKYKIDARFYRKTLRERIGLISKYKGRISVSNLDAIEFLSKKQLAFDNNSLVYLDPPYYNKGQKLYKNVYDTAEHMSVAKAIIKAKNPWLVTYDYSDAIMDLYKGNKFILFQLTYTANIDRPVATEVLFYGNIEMPSYLSESGVIYVNRSGRIETGYNDFLKKGDKGLETVVSTRS